MKFRDPSPYVDIAIAVTAFTAARALAFVAGVRFDASPLPWYWQYLEVDLLRDDLGRSLFHLHAQPPLFNLFLGIVTKISGSDSAAVFSACYFALGVTLAITVPAILRGLGVRRPVALAASVLLVTSPTTLLYGNWLFYTFVVAVGLTVAAYALLRAVASGRTAALAAHFALVAGIALTRSTFHLVWVVACVAVVALASGLPRRRVLAAAAIPVFVVVALYAKNAVMFGGFSASSWAGMSLARMTVARLDPAVGTRWVRDGVLSEIAPIRPFTPLGYYPERWIEPPGEPPTGVPALDRRTKANRYPNFNHRSVPRLSSTYAADAWTVMRRAPMVYAGSVARAWALFWIPPSEIKFVEANRARIAGWDRVYNTLTGQPGRGAPSPDEFLRDDLGYLATRVQWLWLLAVVAAFAHGLHRAVRDLRSREPARVAPAVTLLFVLGTVAWVAVVSNGLEFDENNRFRAMVEPLSFVLVAVAASDLVGRFRSRRR